MTAADPVAIFGVAGFTIMLLITALGILWKRLIQREDQLDRVQEKAFQAIHALETATEFVQESIRSERRR